MLQFNCGPELLFFNPTVTSMCFVFCVVVIVGFSPLSATQTPPSILHARLVTNQSQALIFSAAGGGRRSKGGSNLRDSHPDDVLNVEVLQWRDVGVVTLVVLQDHLLDDAVQQQPVLYRVAAPLICGGRGSTRGRSRRLAWAATFFTLTASRPTAGGRQV